MIDSPALHLLANLDGGPDFEGEVEIDPRSEPDQSKDFTPFQEIARFRITDDPPCHNTRDLNQNNMIMVFRLYENDILLVEKGGLFGVGHKEFARDNTSFEGLFPRRGSD